MTPEPRGFIGDGERAPRGGNCACGAPHYARGLCRRCYLRAWKRARGAVPRDPRTRFDTIAEAFRAYWESESDEEFQRAKSRARRAVWRFAETIARRRVQRMQRRGLA